MAAHRIVTLSDASLHLETVARWNHAEWGAAAGRSLADSEDWFSAMMRSPSEECLIAIAGHQIFGMASLTDHDLESRPDLLHWLASVYVAPEHRGRGLASELVAAVERTAANRGIGLLHLYTREAEGLYEALGWKAVERFTLDTHAFALMTKEPSA